MANEATLSTQLQDRFPECTVAAGVTIAKGTLLQLTDPNTGSASSADGEIPLGIATMEKDSADDSTKLTYSNDGIYEMVVSATVTAGDPLKISGVNTVTLADDATAAGLKEVVGYARQSGTTSESILVRVKC